MNKKVIEAINTCKWLRLSERRVLIGLWSFWSKHKSIYASYDYFADNWGISSSTVKRSINRLKSYGIIEVQNRKGNTNQIYFSKTKEELISMLEADTPPQEILNEPSKSQNDLGLNHSDLGSIQNDPTQGQNDLGSEVKMASDTEDNTDTHIEKDTDFNIETNTDASIDDGHFFDDSPTKDNAEHIPTIVELVFAEDISNEMKELQRIQNEIGMSKPYEVAKQFQMETGRKLVSFASEGIEENIKISIYGETTKATTQSQFDRGRFMVVDSSWKNEIISQYE